MKKFLCLILLIPLIGCAQKTNIKPVTRNISFTAEMTYFNEYYEMAVDIKANGDTTFSMQHPEELKGLIFNVKDDNLTAEFSGIKIETDNNYKAAAVNFLYSAFKTQEYTVYENDNRFFVKGDCDVGEYKMYISGAGLPIKITDNANRFEIVIKNLKINKEKEP